MDLKENSCVLFKNAKKETDAQPEYKGQVNVEGKLYDLALWGKTSEKGAKYFSGKVYEPYKRDTIDSPPPPVDKQKVEEPDDELPF